MIQRTVGANKKQTNKTKNTTMGTMLGILTITAEAELLHDLLARKKIAAIIYITN
jgi:hypothetical protein